jgi:hypothetical protein
MVGRYAVSAAEYGEEIRQKIDEHARLGTDAA